MTLRVFQDRITIILDEIDLIVNFFDKVSEDQLTEVHSKVIPSAIIQNFRIINSWKDARETEGVYPVIIINCNVIRLDGIMMGEILSVIHARRSGCSYPKITVGLFRQTFDVQIAEAHITSKSLKVDPIKTV